MSQTLASVRQQLARAGYQDAGGGLVQLEADAAYLAGALRHTLHTRLRPDAEMLQAPDEIEHSALHRSGYLDAFPKQLIAAGSRTRYATPAACLHLYPRLEGKRLSEDPLFSMIVARCGRHEGGHWRFPFRLCRFEMVEVVVVGSAATVARAAARLESRLCRLLGRLGVTGTLVPAADPFFAGGPRAGRVFQLLHDAKHEYRAGVGRRTVALASLNKHRDHFTARFGISARSGGVAHSACLAVGLERLTAWCLLTWGADPAGWPEPLRP